MSLLDGYNLPPVNISTIPNYGPGPNQRVFGIKNYYFKNFNLKKEIEQGCIREGPRGKFKYQFNAHWRATHPYDKSKGEKYENPPEPWPYNKSQRPYDTWDAESNLSWYSLPNRVGCKNPNHLISKYFASYIHTLDDDEPAQKVWLKEIQKFNISAINIVRNKIENFRQMQQVNKCTPVGRNPNNNIPDFTREEIEKLNNLDWDDINIWYCFYYNRHLADTPSASLAAGGKLADIGKDKAMHSFLFTHRKENVDDLRLICKFLSKPEEGEKESSPLEIIESDGESASENGLPTLTPNISMPVTDKCTTGILETKQAPETETKQEKTEDSIETSLQNLLRDMQQASENNNHTENLENLMNSGDSSSHSILDLNAPKKRKFAESLEDVNRSQNGNSNQGTTSSSTTKKKSKMVTITVAEYQYLKECEKFQNYMKSKFLNYYDTNSDDEKD